MSNSCISNTYWSRFQLLFTYFADKQMCITGFLISGNQASLHHFVLFCLGTSRYPWLLIGFQLSHACVTSQSEIQEVASIVTPNHLIKKQVIKTSIPDTCIHLLSRGKTWWLIPTLLLLTALKWVLFAWRTIKEYINLSRSPQLLQELKSRFITKLFLTVFTKAWIRPWLARTHHT